MAKTDKKEAIKKALKEKINDNILKIKECLKNGDQTGADHYNSLNKQLSKLAR